MTTRIAAVGDGQYLFEETVNGVVLRARVAFGKDEPAFLDPEKWERIAQARVKQALLKFADQL